MADWLYESAPATPDGLAAYSVLDAVGMRLGNVDGWARAPGGAVAFLSLGSPAALREGHALVPLGYVTQVDARRRHVRLRELTRKAIAQRLPRYDGALPHPEALVAALREAPDVRPEIALVLADPARGVRPLFPRGWDPVPEAGDGQGGLPPRVPAPRVPASPVPAPRAAAPARPVWQPLARLAGPAWEM